MSADVVRVQSEGYQKLGRIRDYLIKEWTKMPPGEQASQVLWAAEIVGAAKYLELMCIVPEKPEV